MATLREIRRRIIGIKSTQQITKAMKMVAAARLRKAQEANLNFRPYSNSLENLLRDLLVNIDNPDNVLCEKREINKITVVVVTSDRGLCGSFNSNILRFVEDYLNTELKGYLDNEKVELVCIGKKGYDYLSKRHYKIVEKYINMFSNLTFDISREIIYNLVNRFITKNTDKVIVIYNEFKSIINQQIRVKQFLPIYFEKREEESKIAEGKYKVFTQFIYEPSKEKIIDSLIPKFLDVQMWRVLLESNTSEQAARMTAMDNATENAKELLRILNLSYNRARQAAITKELLEIVAGADALKEKK